MYRIVSKKMLNATVCEMYVHAPLAARHAEAGQFVILRPLSDSERIPLTVAGADRDGGLIRIIFQTVGETTGELASLPEGGEICDLVGPLGRATECEGAQRVCIVGGGVGCAIALPIAEKLHSLGAFVHSIIGFRTSELVILRDDFAKVSDKLSLVTDDGSEGERGNVCMPLTAALEAGERYDRIIAIGPLVMMKYVCEAARPYGIPVTVSMNPIMIDGTGMCGGCRTALIEDGKRVWRLACTEGPEFDGYKVDFDTMQSRQRAWAREESHRRDEHCALMRRGEEQN